MSVQPIYNPVIPCVQQIPGGAYPGLMIRIRGSTFPNSDRFAINLQCGPNTDPRDDIALHLNVRYEHMCIVRNNLCNMNWGPEEIDGGMPIQRGQPFEALLLIEHNSIKVAFNGAHFCEFAHRVPYQRISHMTIDGDVSVQTIGFEGAAPPPPQYAPPTQPGYGYGGPQPQGNYGQPFEPSPMYAGGVQGMPMQQRSGMGTGAAVGLGVGALAAGGLAGYALGGGFSSHDSPSDEPPPSSPPVEYTQSAQPFNDVTGQLQTQPTPTQPSAPVAPAKSPSLTPSVSLLGPCFPCFVETTISTNMVGGSGGETNGSGTGSHQAPGQGVPRLIDQPTRIFFAPVPDCDDHHHIYDSTSRLSSQLLIDEIIHTPHRYELENRDERTSIRSQESVDFYVQATNQMQEDQRQQEQQQEYQQMEEYQQEYQDYQPGQSCPDQEYQDQDYNQQMQNYQQLEDYQRLQDYQQTQEYQQSQDVNASEGQEGQETEGADQDSLDYYVTPEQRDEQAVEEPAAKEWFRKKSKANKAKK